MSGRRRRDGPTDRPWPVVEIRIVTPGQIFVAVEIGCAGCGTKRLAEFGRSTYAGADRRLWQQSWRQADGVQSAQWTSGPGGANEVRFTCRSCPERELRIPRARIEAALDSAERDKGPLGRIRIDL